MMIRPCARLPGGWSGRSAMRLRPLRPPRNSNQLHETSCLITDVQMPGLSGIELQSRLAATGRCMPIIFVTAYPEDRIRARALEAGACGFLSKPFRDECLIGCLNKALDVRDGDEAGR